MENNESIVESVETVEQGRTADRRQRPRWNLDPTVDQLRLDPAILLSLEETRKSFHRVLIGPLQVSIDRKESPLTFITRFRG